ISSFFALHMASFGGTAVLWLYFLLGLAGAWLFYSGNLLWVETRRKAQRKGVGTSGALPEQRRDTALMAA
ncbi:PepSY-associated TM helix domain-containing protein, partial [Diaphorobacter nitroreducens]|uniref:PepSY-associated TM helix domain-containing protein n=3 Tax=Diaphorobacter TaxID=238749 RepID=UPI0028A89334